MKTQAMEDAPADAMDCLYPFADLLGKKGYPSRRQFDVVRTRNRRGTGIKTRVAFDSRILMAKISGYALGERHLHTLQISSRIHLYDPWFSGLILHSCDPNLFLDISELELWSVQAIRPGTLLTMDYATTEDALLCQFACQCGALNCRGWITGAKEPLNPQGQLFMEQWRQRKRC